MSAESEIREYRAPVHFRRTIAPGLRRPWDLWICTQALVERLGILSGGFTVTLHAARVTKVALDVRWRRDRPDVPVVWPDVAIATRMQRLLAGSRLKFGVLTVEVSNGRVKWIAPSPRLRGVRDELIDLAWLFDGRA